MKNPWIGFFVFISIIFLWIKYTWWIAIIGGFAVWFLSPWVGFLLMGLFVFIPSWLGFGSSAALKYINKLIYASEAPLTAIILLVVVLPLVPSLKHAHSKQDSTVKYFMQSIKKEQEAVKIRNAEGAYTTIGKKKIHTILDKSQDALDKATLVDINNLNHLYNHLGDHYKNEFMKGLKLFINGANQKASAQFIRGQSLLFQWQDWFSKNYKHIGEKIK